MLDWSRRDWVGVKNHVGVFQADGTSLELLPKVELGPQADPALARANLIQMLAVVGVLPLRPRDAAQLATDRVPLLQAFIQAFAERLLDELRRGVDHAYRRQEENGPTVKGRLMLTEHLRYNLARPDRVYTTFEEYVADTPVNRLLKAACRRLVGLSGTSRGTAALTQALLLFADVAETRPLPTDFDRLVLNRNQTRFVGLLDFAKVLLFNQAPTLGTGSRSAFGLLFPMEQVFELFVARLLQRHAESLGLGGCRIHVQGRGAGRWLVFRDQGGGAFRLKPDILIQPPGQDPPIVLDTKWKRLKPDSEQARNGVSPADAYQLYAYTRRYGSARSILLYPRVDGVTEKRYGLSPSMEQTIEARSIAMNHDLSTRLDLVLADLRRVLNGPPARHLRGVVV